MPAQSQAQQHVANMARAVKHGKLLLRDVPAGARKAVESMAAMPESQLDDFQHAVPHAPQRKTLLTR